MYVHYVRDGVSQCGQEGSKVRLPADCGQWEQDEGLNPFGMSFIHTVAPYAFETVRVDLVGLDAACAVTG